VSELARRLEALLFLSPEPVAGAELREALDCSGEELDAALAELREALAPGARGLELKEVAGGLHAGQRAGARGRRPAAARPPAHPAADAGPGRDALDRRLPGARSRGPRSPDPRRLGRLGVRHAARARAHRGGGPLAVRRGPVPHDAAVPQALRPVLARRPARRQRLGSRRPRSRPSCASACWRRRGAGAGGNPAEPAPRRPWRRRYSRARKSRTSGPTTSGRLQRRQVREAVELLELGARHVATRSGARSPSTWTGVLTGRTTPRAPAPRSPAGGRGCAAARAGPRRRDLELGVEGPPQHERTSARVNPRRTRPPRAAARRPKNGTFRSTAGVEFALVD
jgi:hypothetical protein